MADLGLSRRPAPPRMVDHHHRLPMTSLSVNIPSSSSGLMTGHKRAESLNSLHLDHAANQGRFETFYPSQDPASRPKNQSLPSFREVFGPREALPAVPKSAGLPSHLAASPLDRSPQGEGSSLLHPPARELQSSSSAGALSAAHHHQSSHHHHHHHHHQRTLSAHVDLDFGLSPTSRKRKSDPFKHWGAHQLQKKTYFPSPSKKPRRSGGPGADPHDDDEPARSQHHPLLVVGNDPFKRSKPRVSEPYGGTSTAPASWAGSSTTGGGGGGGGGSTSPAPNPFDVTHIHLPGEETNSVPVHDTCDAVRHKICAFLSHRGVTQAAFLRAIATSFHDGRRFQGAQLSRFLALQGPSAGSTSGVFYAAYVFFEKTRIRDGEPKSAERLELERRYPEGFNSAEVRNCLPRVEPQTQTQTQQQQHHQR